MNVLTFKHKTKNVIKIFFLKIYNDVDVESH